MQNELNIPKKYLMKRISFVQVMELKELLNVKTDNGNIPTYNEFIGILTKHNYIIFLGSVNKSCIIADKDYYNSLPKYEKFKYLNKWGVLQAIL